MKLLFSNCRKVELDGSDGNFAPNVYTNSSGSILGATQIADLPAVDSNWTTNTYTFTASAGQDGDTWLGFHSGPSGSSGIIYEFCGEQSSAGLQIVDAKFAYKQVVKIVNLLGQETEYKPNTPLIYIYSDGSTEKVYSIEQ